MAANHVKPAVVTLSLGMPEGHWSAALDAAVQSLISDHGVRLHEINRKGKSGYVMRARRMQP